MLYIYEADLNQTEPIVDLIIYEADLVMRMSLLFELDFFKFII